MDAETRNGPLAGYRVLEMGSTIAGPFCGRLLADFGAEVIKVEPAEGDAVRLAGKRFKGKSLYAASIFRNKTLISVDLRRPRGQEVIKRLVPHCDIVVENFRPGGLEKWGLGYSDLARIKPDIIMVRISGYGQSGPYSPRPGYGVICEAVSGLRHLTGDPDRPPARVAIALTDYITGVYAAFGAILALRTASPTTLAYSVANRMGSALANSVPNNLYPTRDGRYIHIQAAQNPVFKRLAAAMGMPELLEDERFATALGRQQHPQETDGIVERWTSSHALAEIESKLKTAEVPAAGINTLEDIFRDPHFRARGMLVEAPDGELGTVTLAGPVPKLSATPAQIRRSGGSIGQDTRRVLTGLAGYAETDLKQLEAQGIVYCDPKS
ncbi:MAG: CoA transferase [Betaproteobacteria bacterium]|nr:CoA transferase [Betaproteobacteria bacterium]